MVNHDEVAGFCAHGDGRGALQNRIGAANDRGCSPMGSLSGDGYGADDGDDDGDGGCTPDWYRPGDGP